MNPGLLIHYGSKKYDPSKVMKIKNQKNGWAKPNGGLWTSPLNSKFGWKEWCHLEKFRVCTRENSFLLELKDTAKIYIIDSKEDLESIPYYGQYSNYPDFEKLTERYDAIWLTYRGEIETRWSIYTYLNLYGWDCESVLILNTSCCKEISN